MNPPRNIKRTQAAFALILLLVISVMTLYVPPFTASNMGIVPDSVEYATAAWRLVNEGRYVITINGEAYPPRYAPGFALFVLAPAYLLFGQGAGNAIFGILFWSLVGIAAAFSSGRRIGGLQGGLMAGAALLLFPYYRYYSQVIMSDAVCAAGTLVLLLAYLRLADAPLNWKGWLGAGMVAALVASIRPTGLSASLPFLWLALRTRPRPRSLGYGLLFLQPVLLVTALQSVYNFRALGSPFRSGYHFWCPVPYDYVSLTLGLSYVPRNFVTVWLSGLVVLLACVAILFLLERRSGWQTESAKTAFHESLRFIAITALPMSLFHLLYFFGDPRFFLPVTGPLAAVVGAMGYTLLFHLSKRLATIAVATALCLPLVLPSLWQAREPTRRLAVDRFDRTLPKTALLISQIDPVYLDFFLNREAERTVLPLSRSVEYASKIAAPSAIPTPNPPPLGALDHRCMGLLNGGGLDVFGATASEPAGLDIIDAALANGSPVFFDATHLGRAELPLAEMLQRRYRMEPMDQIALYRLSR